MTISRTAHLASGRHDRGFTLVELVIAMSLLSIVVTIVGSMIISAIRAESTVREVTGTSTNGQVALNVIEQTVRNATELQVTPDADGASVFVALRTSVGGAAQCHAFFYDAPTDRILQRPGSTTAIPAPVPGEVGSDWTSLSGGVVPIVVDGVAEPVFAQQGSLGLAVTFAVEQTSRTGALFITAVTGRGPDSNASPQCF